MEPSTAIAELEARVAELEKRKGALREELELVYEARKDLVCPWDVGTVLERFGRHYVVQEVSQRRGRVTVTVQGAVRRKGRWVPGPTMYPRIPEHELKRYRVVDSQ